MSKRNLQTYGIVKGKSLLSMNFRSTHHLCEFVFVETIELLLTTSESIFQYALYKRVEYINNSQNQTVLK